MKTLKQIQKKISYYVWASFRRRKIDRFLESVKSLYQGVVLDIGGRDRGAFRKPREQVRKWIHADIAREHQPDLCMDVAAQAIKSDSIDVVNAMELFEHVLGIDGGLQECFRVLKEQGLLIISVPFLYPVHADPFDFQRWTKDKWERELDAKGFVVERSEVSGYFFHVAADMGKACLKSVPGWLKIPCYIFLPLLDLVAALDQWKFVRAHPILSRYQGGYFFVVRKISKPR